MTTKLYDVLIIGGGPAGLAVATGLARQLQKAIVLDSGIYRNARSKHMHNVPGWDHVDPAVFRARAKEDLLRRYDTIEFKSAAITQIQKLANGHFRATDETGSEYTGRKVALGVGVRDIMPSIEGYTDCWGRGIFHCLFCHGFEERGASSAGLLATDMLASSTGAAFVGNMALQLAKKVTVYTHGNDQIVRDIQESWAKPRSRISFDTRKIVRLELAAEGSPEIILTFDDGTQSREAFLAHHPLVELNGPFVQQLGLELGPQGEIKVSPPCNETSVPGVFAAGDATSPIRAVMTALSTGALAAPGLVHQLQLENAMEED